MHPKWRSVASAAALVKMQSRLHTQPRSAHPQEHCLMGVRGNVRRSTDGHIIHANVDTDVIISEEPDYGSTAKPEEMYAVIEHFALGGFAVPEDLALQGEPCILEAVFTRTRRHRQAGGDVRRHRHFALGEDFLDWFPSDSKTDHDTNPPPETQRQAGGDVRRHRALRPG